MFYNSCIKYQAERIYNLINEVINTAGKTTYKTAGK